MSYIGVARILDWRGETNRKSHAMTLSKFFEKREILWCKDILKWTEVESSRTSLASRTHFEVLGLGLEASSPRKLPCPRLENSSIFWTVVVLLENAGNHAANLRTPFLFSSLVDRLKKIFEDLLSFFFFLKNTCACVLGPWPWPREGLSLALASKFFVSLALALASSLVSSTPPLKVENQK